MEYPKALGPMLGRCAHLTRERMDARLPSGWSYSVVAA